MAYASFREERPETPELHDVEVNGKGLARVYGYMGIALAITAAVAVLVAWLFSAHVNSAQSLQQRNGWVYAFFTVVGVSALAVIILSIVMPVRLARGKRSLWVPFILYAIFMGALLSVVLVAGISWAIIGEAFGISAAAFLIMFFIGYFAKKDFSLGAYIGISILSMAMLLIAFWLIFGILSGGLDKLAVYRLDMIYSGIVCLIMLIFIAIDGYRIKEIARRGSATNNVFLFCAYMMYSDFIALLIRVIYILARAQKS